MTGLARDVVIASTFGAGASLDAFYVAFRIPNLLRRLFGEGAFSQAFVPTLAHLRASEGDAATQRMVDAVATVLFYALAITCVIGVDPDGSLYHDYIKHRRIGEARPYRIEGIGEMVVHVRAA